MEGSRKQNGDGVKLTKLEDGIGNVGRGRGMLMTGPRNVEANGKNLRLLDVASGTSAEGAGRSRDIECQRRDR
jgi:succinyl-CoA synthetase beta subunit